MTQKVVIFDIDGTLANNTHRQHFLLPPIVLDAHVHRSNKTAFFIDCESCRSVPGEHHKPHCEIVAGWKKDWEGFFNPKLQIQDTLIQPVFEIYQALKAVGHPIALLTGRPERYREVTRAWLAKHNLFYHDMFMRLDDDHTDDHIWKIQITEQTFGLENIACVFEDRLRIVEAWRAAGVFCFHVGGGDF